MKAASCQFSNLEVTDQRQDELTAGIVYDGTRLCKLQFYRPLPLYLKEIFDSSTAALPKGNNTLVIQLLKTSYTDGWALPLPGFTNQFSIRVNLWVRTGNEYRAITGIDTTIVTGNKNVPAKASRLLSSFFEELFNYCNLNRSWINEPVFTAEQLAELEKRRNARFEVNKAQQVSKGAFFSINEFRNNAPLATDYSLQVDDERFCELYAAIPPQTKKRKIKQYPWVILSNGISAGILIQGVLYPIVKIENSWYFTAFTEKKQSTADMLFNLLTQDFSVSVLNSSIFIPAIIPLPYKQKEMQKILYTVDLFDGEIIPLKPL